MKIKFLKEINNGALVIPVGCVASVSDSEGLEQIQLGNAIQVHDGAMCMEEGDQFVGCLSPDQLGKKEVTKKQVKSET
jgi:hypothetical protein